MKTLRLLSRVQAILTASSDPEQLDHVDGTQITSPWIAVPSSRGMESRGMATGNASCNAMGGHSLRKVVVRSRIPDRSFGSLWIVEKSVVQVRPSSSVRKIVQSRIS